MGFDRRKVYKTALVENNFQKSWWKEAISEFLCYFSSN